VEATNLENEIVSVLEEAWIKASDAKSKEKKK
jgi:hypothetical protein